MKFFKKILDFYIHSSLHVAFAIASLVLVSENYLDLNDIQNEFFIVFFGTVSGYNFLKYFELFFHKKLLIKENKLLVSLTISCLFASAFFFIQLSELAQFLVIGIFGLICLYPLIRRLGWLKTVWVAFCVTGLTVFLPSFMSQLDWNDYKIVAFQRFFITFGLLIPFEIYDSKFDDLALQTLPHRFGIKTTKIIGYVMIVLFLGLNYFDNSNFTLNTVIGLITFLAIYFSNEKRNSYYTAFWVESIPIVWFLLS